METGVESLLMIGVVGGGARGFAASARSVSGNIHLFSLAS